MTPPSPQNILLLGGTHFIGREIVLTLLSAGHNISVFNRGSSPDDLPADVERLRGDRDHGHQGLRALANRRWNACVDVSGYTPRQVRPVAEMLSPAVDRYVYISSGAVYGDQQDRPVRETHSRLPAAAEDVTVIDGDTYGPLKVACENIVQEIFPDRCTFLRPQVVVGPHDTRRRYLYWIHRAMLPGPTLAPGDGSDHLQVIDVRDVARFIATVVQHELHGAFNLAGPRITWQEFVRLLNPADPVWVPADRIRAAGITEDELPLFRTAMSPSSSKMHVSSQRAQSAGLALTDPQTTIRDTTAWCRGRDFTLNLSREQEAELLRSVQVSRSV